MADETLLSAARRVSRFFKIDEAHGGMTSIDTIKAVETMDKEIHKETGRLKDVTPDHGSGGRADG